MDICQQHLTITHVFSNCTYTQWWNGTYCRDKGTPAWGSTPSALCNSTYQCADYNLVTCPLGGSYPTINATCECATYKYWVCVYIYMYDFIRIVITCFQNGYTCVDRGSYGDSCIVWPQYPVNATSCRSMDGLVCNSTNCIAGTNCTGGICHCTNGTTWIGFLGNSFCFVIPPG